MNKNIYMGANSTAGILTHNKVDEDWEILMNIYATAYDAVNNEIMLTRMPQQYDEATVQEVNGRFAVLYKIVKKYAPHLKDEIQQIHKLTIKNLKGEISDRKMLAELRKICRRNGVSEHVLNEIEAKIDAAEMSSTAFSEIKTFDPFGTEKKKQTISPAKLPEFKSFDPFGLGTIKAQAKPAKQFNGIKDFNPFGSTKSSKKQTSTGFNFSDLEKNFSNLFEPGKKNNKKSKKKHGFAFEIPEFKFDFMR